MYETFNKRGKRSKIKAVQSTSDIDLSPPNMYDAVAHGGGSPDSSRRITNNYGKTAGKRAEYKPEVGLASSLAMRPLGMLPYLFSLI